jgi:hypothetical protein
VPDSNQSESRKADNCIECWLRMKYSSKPREISVRHRQFGPPFIGHSMPTLQEGSTGNVVRSLQQTLTNGAAG